MLKFVAVLALALTPATIRAQATCLRPQPGRKPGPTRVPLYGSLYAGRLAGLGLLHCAAGRPIRRVAWVQGTRSQGQHVGSRKGVPCPIGVHRCDLHNNVFTGKMGKTARHGMNKCLPVPCSTAHESELGILTPDALSSYPDLPFPRLIEASTCPTGLKAARQAAWCINLCTISSSGGRPSQAAGA